MTIRAAMLIASQLLKIAQDDPLLVFGEDGSFALVRARGRSVHAGEDIAEAVDRIYGDDMPRSITIQVGTGPEPGQGMLFDIGRSDVGRLRTEEPEMYTTVFSIHRLGDRIRLTLVESDYAHMAANKTLLSSVMDELCELEVHPPLESGESLADSVDAHLDYGREIPREFYEDRFDWNELIEKYNSYWDKQYDDDVKRAIEELLTSKEVELDAKEFTGTIGGVVEHLAMRDLPLKVTSAAIAKELKEERGFADYEELGQDRIYEKTISPILDDIRKMWENRQAERKDDEKFDAMRKALNDRDVDMPNADLVLRMVGVFKDEGWETRSFQQLAKEFSFVARQEMFWKALAKGSPRLTSSHMEAYLAGKNPEASEMLPKEFGAKAVNPPKYNTVAEDDYEGYTIANIEKHMTGVAALYVDEMNEDNKRVEAAIDDAMKYWHIGAHPLNGHGGIGWIRYDIVKNDDDTTTMFIQEIQSDFIWAVEIAAAGGRPDLGGGFPDSWFICPDCGAESMMVEDTAAGADEDASEIWCPECSKSIRDDVQELALRKLAKYVLKKFQGWDHYLLGSLITLARREGVDDVVMNTSETILLNPASAPKSKRKRRWYDDLAGDFGFQPEQVNMYGHDEVFHRRVAKYHKASSLFRRIFG